MRHVLKWIGIVLVALILLFVLATAVFALNGSSKLNRQYDVTPEPVAIVTDTAVIERGAYLASVSCAGCHGNDYGGTPFFQDPALGSIPAPNLTAGQGGIGALTSDADFVRAIRHGIDPEGRPLMIMPASAFWHFSDADLAAIIAFLRSAPPVDNAPGERNLGLMGRVLVGAGALDVLAAAHIDHTAPRPPAPEQAVSADYGAYIANTGDCRSCHGADLAGGQSSEPGAPPAPDLTPGSDLAAWSTTDFITALRTGITPDGRALDPAFMPWQEYGRLTDDDLTALFQYLQSLPATAQE